MVMFSLNSINENITIPKMHISCQQQLKRTPTEIKNKPFNSNT